MHPNNTGQMLFQGLGYHHWISNDFGQSFQVRPYEQLHCLLPAASHWHSAKIRMPHFSIISPSTFRHLTYQWLAIHQCLLHCFLLQHAAWQC